MVKNQLTEELWIAELMQGRGDQKSPSTRHCC